MNKVRCSYVYGHHCDCYNCGTCESITYCTYQDDKGYIEEIERLNERIKELEAEKEKYRIEAEQVRASRDMWAEIPSNLRDDRVGPMTRASDILKHMDK